MNHLIFLTSIRIRKANQVQSHLQELRRQIQTQGSALLLQSLLQNQFSVIQGIAASHFCGTTKS